MGYLLIFLTLGCYWYFNCVHDNKNYLMQLVKITRRLVCIRLDCYQMDYLYAQRYVFIMGNANFFISEYCICDGCDVFGRVRVPRRNTKNDGSRISHFDLIH